MKDLVQNELFLGNECFRSLNLGYFGQQCSKYL